MPTRRNLARYEHLIGFALEHPWAVTPAMRSIVAGILARRIAGADDDEDAIATAIQARDMRTYPVNSGGVVAVIPIFGVIAPRMNLLSDISGGTSFETLSKQLAAAVADPNVKTILFDVDSPGGNVAGATEFAREVLKARTQKRIVAHANYLMASAAYWPMAGASEIVASPSAMVGSIGVYALHDDISEALGQLGIKREIFTAGRYKGEGADGGPLTPEARAHVQSLIDGAYGRFTGDVAKGRGVPPADVRKGFGEGRAVSADDALACGLIDKVATFADTLARCSSSSTDRTSRALESPPVVTTQEPSPATVQEQRAVLDASLSAYELRLLALDSERVTS
jgi:signal peptide peptidase SppA